MDKQNSDNVVSVGQPIDTPSATIPGQQVNPDAMPVSEPFKGDELAAFEVPEVDISAMQLADIETLQNTLGTLRPMQGYNPLPDMPRMQVRNNQAGQSEILERKIQADQNQPSISLFKRGVNYFNPLGLPLLRAADVSQGAIDETSLAALYFSNNGPSIATPGTAKRAAVEQSMQSMRSQIINAFNRDIPFSSMSAAARALALKAYEGELCKIQLFMQAIDILRGYANYQAKMNVPLGTDWEKLFQTDAYVALTALYNAVADLPIFDKQTHDRIEKLARIFTTSKRMSVPGTCIMQDALIAEDHYKEGVTLRGTGQYQAQTIVLNQIIPNLSIGMIWQFIVDGNFVPLVQYYTRRAQNIRTQYEMVITALAQMTSKQALATVPLSGYLPAQPNAFGAMDFASAEPVFSYAFHERMEYAPFYVAEEAGALGGSVTGMWTLMDLPEDDASWAPSQTMMIRPVGLKHGKQAWKVSELVDIGLFRRQSAASVSANGAYTSRVAGDTINIANGVVTCTETQISNASVAVFDAVYGDLYSPGVIYLNGSGRSEMYFWSFNFHGMSQFEAGSGLHNMLPMPGKPASASYSPFPAGLNGGVASGFGYIDELAATDDWQDILPALWFLDLLAESLCFSHFLVGKANGASTRQVTYAKEAGYKDTGYYSMSIATIDNAVAKDYNSMVPFVQYTPRRK